MVPVLTQLVFCIGKDNLLLWCRTYTDTNVFGLLESSPIFPGMECISSTVKTLLLVLSDPLWHFALLHTQYKDVSVRDIRIGICGGFSPSVAHSYCRSIFDFYCWASVGGDMRNSHEAKSADSKTAEKRALLMMIIFLDQSCSLNSFVMFIFLFK